MAKAKAEVNKSEAIRAALADQPAASVKEVVSILKAKGIDVSENLVYGVKKKLKPGKKKAPKATVKAVAPFSKKSVNKSEEIRTIFTATPTASAKEVVATLKAKGIDVSENYVYGVKKTLKPGKKKPGRKPKAMTTVKVALTQAAPSSNGVLGVGASIIVAKAAAEKVGGWSALKEIVDALA
jgi:arginine repressor